MSAFPPHRSVASIPVSKAVALKCLTAYLEAAQNTPYLLPNARLEPSGPTAGSSSSHITIHNLKRVQAGLRGEWLAPTLNLEDAGVPIAEGMDDGTNKGQEEEGWMDLDQYQREQRIEVRDVGDRVPGAVDGAKTDLDLENLDENPHADNMAAAKKRVKKDARKLEKKSRRKEEKALREAKRRAGQTAD